jgi:hypothetical protein
VRCLIVVGVVGFFLWSATGHAQTRGRETPAAPGSRDSDHARRAAPCRRLTTTPLDPIRR